MLLFRPVGLEELRLVYDANMRAFPPRLPDQPIFYPVTSQAYAEQIAREWNTKSGALAGFVTRFLVDDAYVAEFERRIVGAREHEELWVPVEDLAEFNAKIENEIDVVAAFFGDANRGFIPDAFGLRGKDASTQFVALAKTLPYSGFDFQLETSANHTAVFLNYFFWEQTSFTRDDITDDVRDVTLITLRKVWANAARSASRLGLHVDGR